MNGSRDMREHAPAPALNDGTAQWQRLPAAWQGARFEVDALTLAQRIAMVAGLAEALHFLDGEGRPRGRWGELLRRDETVVLARLLAWDTAGERAAFDAIDEFAHDSDRDALASAAAQAVALAARLDHLYKLLLTVDTSRSQALARWLVQHLPLLGDDLAWVLHEYRTAGSAADQARLARTHERLHAHWQLPEARAPRRSARQHLRNLVLAQLGLVQQLQARAADAFEESLASEQHEAAAALLLAFLRLMHLVQGEVNRFTERQIDFYYRECLHFEPRAAVPEKALLVLHGDPGAGEALHLDAGTTLAAGAAPDGTPWLWRSETAVALQSARVQALHTLRLERQEHIWPERLLHWVTRARVASLAPRSAAAAAPAAGGLRSSAPTRRALPLFGGAALPDPSDGATESAAAGRPGDAADNAATDADTAAGSAQAAAAPGGEAARIGLAIASPLLRLAEGERKVQLMLELDLSELPPLAHGEALERALSQPPQEETEFCRRLGRWFQRWLLAPAPAAAGATASDVAASDALGAAVGDGIGDAADVVSEEDLQAIRAAAAPYARLLEQAQDPKLSAGDPLVLLRERGPRIDRRLAFDRLCEDLLRVELSTAEGWMHLPDATFRRAQPVPGGVAGAGGIEITCQLPLSAPPLAPCPTAPVPASTGAAAAAAAAQPMLRLLAQRQTRLFALSLFEGVVLSSVELQVEVSGLTQLELHNQLGRLDPSKPFAPFGPLPDTAGYLIVGAPELAGKPLTELDLHLRWSALPARGFAEHYQGYGPGWDNAAFRVAPALLRDGRWLPAGPAGGGTEALFASAAGAAAATGPLVASSRLQLDAEALKTLWRADAELPAFDQGARNGFVRLQLAAPAEGFGHARYPHLLTEVVSANVRLRRRARRALPQPPYTPMLERLTLRYCAATRVRLGRAPDASAHSAGLRLSHLHPFGEQEIYPRLTSTRPGVLPRLAPDGQLFIALAGASAGGTVNLMFELDDAAAQEYLVRQRRGAPPPRWAVLAQDHWHELADAQVLADSTRGLLTSGVVTLQLPREATRDNHTLPGPWHWLRLATDENSAAFAGLLNVHAQGLCASRLATDGADTPGTAASAPSGPAVPDIPGLSAVQQPMPAFGGRAGETEAQMRQRAGERLRHKNRASLAWDIERLVLERFPAVQKVKCFETTAAGVLAGGARGASAWPLGRAAGRVLVAVVPQAPRNDERNATRAWRLHAAQLLEIQDFLAGQASPLARIEVRNAVYERVQLRCTVRAAPGTHSGHLLQAVNRAVVAYLSPWYDGGHEARFGWSLQGEELEACITAVPTVRGVSRLSLLHLGSDGRGRHWLEDTARAPDSGARIGWRLPWSLVLPTPRHLISIVEGDPGDDRPERTGLMRLAIGQTMVVAPRRPNGPNGPNGPDGPDGPDGPNRRSGPSGRGGRGGPGTPTVTRQELPELVWVLDEPGAGAAP